MIPASGQNFSLNDCLLYLIDDDKATLELYKKVLAINAPELRIHAFLRAGDALKEMEEQEPDLIICDMMMPQMSGEDLVKYITSIDSFCSIPVILVTAGRYDMAFRRKCLDMGAVDFLTKPVDLDDLTCKIRSLLRFRHLAKNLERSNREIQQMQRIIVEHERGRIPNALIDALDHEINNPLTTLIGNLELFLSDPPREKGLDEIQEAYEAALKVRDAILEITKTRYGSVGPGASREYCGEPDSFSREESPLVDPNDHLNNPLTSLIGNMELFLADPPASHKGLDEIQEAYEAALRVRDIIQRVLTVDWETGETISPRESTAVFTS